MLDDNTDPLYPFTLSVPERVVRSGGNVFTAESHPAAEVRPPMPIRAALAGTISAEISVSAPGFWLAYHTNPPKVQVFPREPSLGSAKRQLSPSRENPKPGNTVFSAHSIDTSPTLTSLVAQLRRSHPPKQPPRQMAVGRRQPLVPGMLDQPAAGLDQPLLQTVRPGLPTGRISNSAMSRSRLSLDGMRMAYFTPDSPATRR